MAPGRRVNTNDLLDSEQVAALLGISPTSVRVYASRNPQFPSHVLPREGANGKDKYWVRQDIERWRKKNPPRDRSRDTPGDPS